LPYCIGNTATQMQYRCFRVLVQVYFGNLA
jgi:hypothetical protein